MRKVVEPGEQEQSRWSQVLRAWPILRTQSFTLRQGHLWKVLSKWECQVHSLRRTLHNAALGRDQRGKGRDRETRSGDHQKVQIRNGDLEGGGEWER